MKVIATDIILYERLCKMLDYTSYHKKVFHKTISAEEYARDEK